MLVDAILGLDLGGAHPIWQRVGVASLVHGIEVDPENARPSGDGTVDLVVRLPPDSVDEMGSLVELLDFADEFAARERLLSVARTPAQRTFQTWFLTEFVRQRDGQPPHAWSTPRAYRAEA